MMVAGWVAIRDRAARACSRAAPLLYAACLALWAVTDQPA